MPYEKEKELNHLIYRDIHDFCKENDLYDEFLEITFFVTVYCISVTYFVDAGGCVPPVSAFCFLS